MTSWLCYANKHKTPPWLNKNFKSVPIHVQQRTMLIKFKMFICFLSMIIIFHNGSVRSIKVVKAAEGVPSEVEKRGRVEIAGVGLSDHEDLTVCARFKTYQFGSTAHNYQGIIFAKPVRILGSYSTIIRKPFNLKKNAIKKD